VSTKVYESKATQAGSMHEQQACRQACSGQADMDGWKDQEAGKIVILVDRPTGWLAGWQDEDGNEA